MNYGFLQWVTLIAGSIACFFIIGVPLDDNFVEEHLNIDNKVLNIGICIVISLTAGFLLSLFTGI